MTQQPSTEPRLVDIVTSPDRRAAYLRAGLWDSTTLPGRVAIHAEHRPAAPAVVDEEGQHSYRELHDDASRLATAMAAHGVAAGDVVSVQLPNRYETTVIAVATLSLGAVVNPLLPNYRARELAHVVSTARPAMLFTPSTYRGFDHCALAAEVFAATQQAPVHVIVGGDAGQRAITYATLMAAGTPGPLGAGRAEAVSEVIFTSGTEAVPKAIMHTEQTANFSVRVAFEDLGLGADDVVWMPSPVGHSTGFNYGLRFALYHGLPLVLQDRWDGDAAAALVAAHRCTYTLAATTFLQDLIAAAARAGTGLDSLRYFGCGGAGGAGALFVHPRRHHLPAGPHRGRRPGWHQARLAAVLRLRRR
ncbi:MAG TPA: AMP-binding protein, partial [Ilumatobacteraceae bacterium]